MAECEELVESGAGEDAEDMPPVVAAFAGILERVAERNDAAEVSGAVVAAPASAFRATTKPGISVRAYMARIARFAGCSPACYVVAYVYLDRLLRRGRRLALAVDSYSVHRLLITAVLAATFGDYCAVLQSELQRAAAPPAPLRLHHCCLSEDDAGAGCTAQQQLAA
nr:unnamed protein product [Digitaria exilis]